MLTELEIIERAFDRLDPEREFRESAALLLASRLASEHPTNNIRCREMKAYTFELVIHEGSDHFWDTNPSDKEVLAEIADTLSEHGWFVNGDGNDTLTLTKFELLK